MHVRNSDGAVFAAPRRDVIVDDHAQAGVILGRKIPQASQVPPAHRCGVFDLHRHEVAIHFQDQVHFPFGARTIALGNH